MRHAIRLAAVGSSGAAAVIAVLRLAVLAAIASLGLTAPAGAMKIQQIKSPGGIEAWLVEERGVPLIALRFLFDGGNSQDPPGKDGLANFMTAMMDEGAGDLVSEVFQERMEDITMRMRYDDSKDAFYGTVETLTANKDKAFELLKLAVQKPRFDADAVDRIRQQLMANVIYADKDPDKVAANAWYGLAFDGHPYGRRSNGTLETLQKINRDDLVAFHKRTFARDNLKVVAVGDISADELGKVLDEVFGALPAAAEMLPVAKTTPVNSGKQQVIEMNVPQSVAMFGFGAMARKDPDFMPAFVLNHIIGGGGFSAKLMEEVREKRGLAYSVYTYLQTFQHASILAGSVATKNESVGESLKIIRSELKKMAENGPAPEDLAAAKSYLTGSYALRFDTNSKIATQLLGLMQEGFGPDYIETRNKIIEAITVDDVKRVAKRLLNVDNLIVTIVGKPAGLEALPVAAPALAPRRG